MAWSVRMSPAAREDIKAMFQAAFETVMQIIAKGERLPFGVLLDHDGRIVIRLVSPPPGSGFRRPGAGYGRIDLSAGRYLAGGVACPAHR